jgi:glycerate 2-kinase
MSRLPSLDYRLICKQIFLEGVKSVMPQNLIGKHLSLSGNILTAGSSTFDLETIENIYVVGAGKASAYMAAAVEDILGERITGGCVSVKYGFATDLRYIKLIEAGHPIPDNNSYTAAKVIIRIANIAGDNDLVISLFSGGGSSLLADAPGNCTQVDMKTMNDLLVNCGAAINEINAVRKHLSGIKGGHLARLVSPSRLINIMISDVPGNNPGVIASGPAVPDETTFQNAADILLKYQIIDMTPVSILKYIEQGVAGEKCETPKPGDRIFDRTINILAGSNMIALEAAKISAESYGLKTKIITDNLHGDVTDVAEYLFDFSMDAKLDNSIAKPACFLFGGEPTIKMTGSGKGGRNQHLALTLADLLQSTPGITVLCAGTDGNDGPTDAAGAVVDSETISSSGSDHKEYLEEFDSYNYFKHSGGHIITGPTFTNVMDMVVILIA